MNVPEPKKTPSGWRIQLRLGGQSIPVTDTDKKRCIHQAEMIKSQYKLNGQIQQQRRRQPTLTDAIDQYIEDRKNVLSPSTVRGYRTIQKHRFHDTMPRRIDSINPSEWQSIINAELAGKSLKTVKNAWGFVKSVLESVGYNVPDKVKLTKEKKKREAAWLEPDEIELFVEAAKSSPYCIPMLLALMSMRISEIDALRWENIDSDAEFIHTQGARVLDENNEWITKREQKTEESDRDVPLMIPELRDAIREQKKPSGKVLSCSQQTLRREVAKTCEKAGVPRVTVHQLRHTFASLSAHLGIPKEYSMEIGGWSNDKTMQEIYTHIARSDIERYKNKMWDFYNKKQAAAQAKSRKHFVSIFDYQICFMPSDSCSTSYQI